MIQYTAMVLRITSLANYDKWCLKESLEILECLHSVQSSVDGKVLTLSKSYAFFPAQPIYCLFICDPDCKKAMSPLPRSRPRFLLLSLLEVPHISCCQNEQYIKSIDIRGILMKINHESVIRVTLIRLPILIAVLVIDSLS